MKKNNLKISNIVFCGKMPFYHKLKLDELNRLLTKSKLKWQLIREDTSPIIRRYVRKNGLTIRKREKNAHISIWTSGSIVITGVTSKKEANIYYEETLKDINKFCRRVLR